MGKIACLRTITEQFRAFAVRDLVGELGNSVCELAFVFFGATKALIHREEAQPSKGHLVEVMKVLRVTLPGEFGGLVAGASFDIHCFGRGLRSIPVDRGGRCVHNGITAVLTSLFNRVHESLDVDPSALCGILFVHFV